MWLLFQRALTNHIHLQDPWPWVGSLCPERSGLNVHCEKSAKPPLLMDGEELNQEPRESRQPSTWVQMASQGSFLLLQIFDSSVSIYSSARKSDLQASMVKVLSSILMLVFFRKTPEGWEHCLTQPILWWMRRATGIPGCLPKFVCSSKFPSWEISRSGVPVSQIHYILT